MIDNPHPERLIERIELEAAADGAVYVVMGVTLSDRAHYVAPEPVSFGGPDNWSGGTCMAALIEGLAGVKDSSTRYRRLRLSPRWTAAAVENVEVVARYAACDGYAAYRFDHHPIERRIELTLTGSGEEVELRILLPPLAERVTRLTVNGRASNFTLERIEESLYAVLPVELPQVAKLELDYAVKA